MKIAYLSVAPFVSSGYGVCTRYICHALAEKHDVTIFSYFGYEGAEIEFRIEDRDVRIVGEMRRFFILRLRSGVVSLMCASSILIRGCFLRMYHRSTVRKS